MTDPEVDGALKFVFDVLHINQGTQNELRSAGVKTLVDLRRKWQQLRDGKVRGVSRMHQDNLCDFASWCQYFEDGKELDVMRDFNEDVFVDFKRSPDFDRTTRLLLEQHNARSGSETPEDAGGKALYTLYLDGGVELRYLTKPKHRATFLPYVAKLVKKSMGACSDENL